MEEVRVRVQDRVFFYHGMSFPSIKIFWVVHYYKRMHYLLKGFLVMGIGEPLLIKFNFVDVFVLLITHFHWRLCGRSSVMLCLEIPSVKVLFRKCICSVSKMFWIVVLRCCYMSLLFLLFFFYVLDRMGCVELCMLSVTLHLMFLFLVELWRQKYAGLLGAVFLECKVMEHKIHVVKLALSLLLFMDALVWISFFFFFFCQFCIGIHVIELLGVMWCDIVGDRSFVDMDL